VWKDKNIRLWIDGTYASRSDADLGYRSADELAAGLKNEIKAKNLSSNKIGRIRAHPSPDEYLRYSMEPSKKKSQLSPNERKNPLFFSGAIEKD